jgi:hypothetical protein
MSQTTRKIKNRRAAKKRLSELLDNPEYIVVIHYSCESFYDRPDGSSPRITSIAVYNLGSGQTNSFSIHQKAEIKKYSSNDIEKYYEELEKLMLDDFYDFVKTHEKYNWLHWNMRDINYGFQAIAHRYKVLGGNPKEIDDSNRVDLSRLLTDIYGDHYISHPRLQRLMDKNQITDKDFLAGAEEADAFKNKEYVKLHQSTLRKVNVIAKIAERAENGSLKTNASWKDIYGGYPEAIGEFLKENWLISLLSFISAILGILGIVIQFLPK